MPEPKPVSVTIGNQTVVVGNLRAGATPISFKTNDKLLYEQLFGR